MGSVSVLIPSGVLPHPIGHSTGHLGWAEGRDTADRRKTVHVSSSAGVVSEDGSRDGSR